VIVRSKEDSGSIALNRYDYMRSSAIDALPKDTTVLLKELGTPVLPALNNGQPLPSNGTMAPVPPKPVLPPPAPRPGATAEPSGQYRPVQRPAGEAPATDPSGQYRPVQK
jgi:general secretion pathway protein D